MIPDLLSVLIPAYNPDEKRLRGILDSLNRQMTEFPNVEIVIVDDGSDIPPLYVGEYKGIEVPKTTVRITEAEIDAEVDRMAERNARLVSVARKAKKGDTAVCMAAGNDLIMPGGATFKAEILLGLRSGKLTKADLRRCCANVLKQIFDSPTQREYIDGNP